MPVRSLTQSVWRWPTADQVLEAVRAWAVIQQQRVPTLVRVGIFGSYGRGTAGFGSDLDLLLVDQQAWGGQVERLQLWPLAELPLSCDAPGRYGTAGNVKRTRPSKRSKSRSKLTKRQPLAMAMAAK